MNNAVASNSNLKNDYQNQRYEERQVNFICEAFRTAVEKNQSNAEMVPLVIYQSDRSVPNGGLEDIVEVHGVFDSSTIQTAIFRLGDDLTKWCLEQPIKEEKTSKPSIVTEVVKNEAGEITAIKFIKRKVHPFWSPHRRRYSLS